MRALYRAGLLDSDHHRIGAYEVADFGFAEADLAHPGHAITAGVVETACGFYEHVETHHQSESVLRTVVVDNGFVDDHSAARVERVMSLAQECLFFVEIPVVEYVAHGDHVHVGQWVVKEIGGMEPQAIAEAVLFDIFLKNGADFGKIVADAV